MSQNQPPQNQRAQAQPPQGQGGYPLQPGGYPPQAGGYPPQSAYNPQVAYNPQGVYGQPAGYPQQGAPQPHPGGYGPQGPGGYPPGPQGPPGGYASGGGPPKKSSLMIIGIVVAAVLLLVAVGGIVMALNSGGDDQPTSTITPGQPAPPTDNPTESPSADPSVDPPSPAASTRPPSGQPPSADPSDKPANPGGSSVSLGQGISVTPASGWKLKNKGDGSAQLSNGRDLFVGLVGDVDPGSNPVQFCDAYHRKLGEKATNGTYSKAKALDLKSSKLDGASCLAEVTVSSGQGSTDVLLYSVVSIRTDGVTVVGTLYFTEATDTKALGDDFVVMVNSMLEGQSAG